MDHIIENRIEACIVTETWLSDSDDIWISNIDFTKHNYNIHSGKQTEWDRRWLGINLQNNSKFTSSKKSTARSSEYEILKLTAQSTSITITAVYHPLYSEKNPITNAHVHQ